MRITELMIKPISSAAALSLNGLFDGLGKPRQTQT